MEIGAGLVGGVNGQYDEKTDIEGSNNRRVKLPLKRTLGVPIRISLDFLSEGESN